GHPDHPDHPDPILRINQLIALRETNNPRKVVRVVRVVRKSGIQMSPSGTPMGHRAGAEMEHPEPISRIERLIAPREANNPGKVFQVFHLGGIAWPCGYPVSSTMDAGGNG